MSDPAQRHSRLILSGLVSIVGLIVLVPNALPLIAFWRADRAQAVEARWVGSAVTSSSRDTVGVPAFAFQRRIGPIVQDCRIDLVQYRHAPGGKPRFETLTLVPGATCTDIIVLDDPPRERWPLVAIGAMIALAGMGMAGLALRGGRA